MVILDSRLTKEEIKSKYQLDNRDVPYNFREVSEEDIVKSTFRIYGFIASWWDRIPIDNEYTKTDTYLFGCFDNTGVAMVFDVRQNKIRWFAFGCQHEYKEMTRKEVEEYNKDKPYKEKLYQGNCYHNCICTKCGFIFSYDSSD